MLRAKARKKKQGKDDDDQKKEKEKDERRSRRDMFGRKRKKKRKSRKDGLILKDVVAIGILICFFLFVFSLYFKEPRGRVFVKTKTENKKRARTKVIAIGDVHGDEDVLRRLLFATGATDN